MAGFTRTHGDSQPVFAIDVQNGPVSSTANANGTPTNFVGPAFDFFGLDLGAAPTTQLGVNGAISAVNQAIEQLATVMIYQVQASATAVNMSVAVYPVGAWTTTTIAAAIAACGTVNGYDLSGCTATNVGFKLAAS
jgi:hypothetical protein